MTIRRNKQGVNVVVYKLLLAPRYYPGYPAADADMKGIPEHHPRIIVFRMKERIGTKLALSADGCGAGLSYGYYRRFAEQTKIFVGAHKMLRCGQLGTGAVQSCAPGVLDCQGKRLRGRRCGSAGAGVTSRNIGRLYGTAAGGLTVILKRREALHCYTKEYCYGAVTDSGP